MKKHYAYKIYSRTGQFIKDWTDVVNEPHFQTVINAGSTELVVELARRSQSFGEGDDVAFGNELQLWCFDDDAPAGVKIFAGHLDHYVPITQGPRELIRCRFLGFQTELANYIYEDAAGQTQLAHNSTDPGTIAEFIIDRIGAQGARLDWDEASLQKTGTEVSHTFNTASAKEAIDKVLELTPANWFWYVDADKKLHLHPKKTIAEHTVTIGKEIVSIEPQKRIENVINRIYFTGGGDPPLFRRYERAASIQNYGLHALSKVDQRITLTNTMDTIAENLLDANEDAEIRTIIALKDNSIDRENGYDIESIRIGQTLQVRNYQDASTASRWDVMDWDMGNWDFSVANLTETVMQIVALDYAPHRLTVTISSKPPQIAKRIEDINRNLMASLTNNNPSSPAIGS
jgi:hypothetical protein